MVGLANHFTLDSTIKLAVQCDLINKPAKPISDYLLGKHGHGWDNTELSIRQLRKHIIESGFAFSTASLTSGNRKTENFKSSSGILLDFDENTSLVDAQNNPVLRSIATAGYTTPSHTAENPRCKILCLYDRPVTDASLQRRYTELVMKLVADMKPDTSGKDATRFSYGNAGGEWLFIGNGLSVDKLNQMIANEAIEAETKHTPIKKTEKRDNAIYENIIQFKQGKTWLDENARRITGKFPITHYGDNGYSNKFSCPCPLHNNNDESPSAAWHRDKYHLHCFASGKNYKVKATAEMMGIELDSVSEARRGLWNSTREYLLGHVVKSDKGYNTQPLASLCRCLDAMVMYGVGSGWYSIAELDIELNGLFDTKTLRYAIGNNLIDSNWYSENASFEDKALFVSVDFLDTSSRDISYSMVETNGINYLTVPPPPPPRTGRGRKTIYFFIPTEQELMQAMGIERGIYHDWISIADIQTNDTYTQALNRVLIEQRPSKYSQKWLGRRIGKSARTIRSYVSNDNTLKTRQNEVILGIVDNPLKLPVKPVNYRFLQMADSRTGELRKFPYSRSSYESLIRFGQVIYAGTRTANSYWSTKGKPLQETIENTQVLEQAS